MTESQSPSLRGRCLCGDNRYEITGKPLWVAHCHCESCRRATSAAVATWIGLHKESFRHIKGEMRHFNSSPGVQRSFCPRCGSPLIYVGEKWPDEVHVLAATLDDPNQVQPRAHVNTAEEISWADLHDDLPRFAQIGKGAKPTRIGPRIND